MKRTTTAVLVAAVVLLLIGSLAYAQRRGHDGMRGAGYGSATTTDAYGKFRDESAPLREQLQNKRDEIRAERHKPAPDSARIDQLREEMTGLRSQIHSIAEKHGVKGGYFCGTADCPTGGKHAMGRGEHGRGMHGRDTANRNCPFAQ